MGEKGSGNTRGKQASGNYEKEPFEKKASEMKTPEHGHSFAFLVVSYFFMLCVAFLAS